MTSIKIVLILTSFNLCFITAIPMSFAKSNSENKSENSDIENLIINFNHQNGTVTSKDSKVKEPILKPSYPKFARASKENFTSAIGKCLANFEIIGCFKKRIIETLDNVINDNSTWYLSDYLIIEKDNNWKEDNHFSFSDLNNSTTVSRPVNKKPLNPTVSSPPVISSSSLPQAKAGNMANYDDLNKIFLLKLKDIIESRTIRLRVTPEATHEGRKKKDKGQGGYAIMGGLAMAGVMAQIFMGKVAMLAGVALIMAKVALLFSVFNSLKKAAGSGAEHIVYADSVGGGHSSGWHRTFPRNVGEDAYGTNYPEDDDKVYRP